MKLMYKLLYVGIIIIMSVVLLLHYTEVYNANKNMDEFLYIQNAYGDYYNIVMCEEAKELPVFFHRWKCNSYFDDPLNMYLDCKHCKMFSFNECSNYIFPLNLLTSKEKIIIEEKKNKTESENRLIVIFTSLCSIACLIYWFWLWKNNPSEWEKTPFAKFYRWLEKNFKTFNEVKEK